MKDKELKKIGMKIVPVLKKYGVTKAGIFGSHARGEQKKKSDIDVLVKIDKEIGLFEFIALKLELERIVGRKVDLGEYNSIKEAIKKSVLKEEVRII